MVTPSAAGATAGRFDRALARLENALTFVSAAAIFFLMLVGVFQVVARTVFGVAIYGYIDWIEQSTAIVAFFGLAYCQRLGSHIRMDITLRLLSARLMWMLEATGVILALVVVTLLIESTFANFLRAYQLGDSTMDIKLPVWPSKLAVPIALSVLWLRLAVQLAGYLRLVAQPTSDPGALPKVESAEAMARAEIDEAFRAAEGNKSP